MQNNREIEPKYMQKIGIREGDIVKISGITKNTAAVCLPMSNSDLQEIVAPKMEVEFFEQSWKKDASSSENHHLWASFMQCRCFQREWQPTIKLGKFPESQIRSENIAEAELVTRATMNNSRKNDVRIPIKSGLF